MILDPGHGTKDSVTERALFEDYNSREHSCRIIRVLIYHRLTLQLYNHDFIHNILINAHDYIIFISNTTVPILFTTDRAARMVPVLKQNGNV